MEQLRVTLPRTTAEENDRLQIRLAEALLALGVVSRESLVVHRVGDRLIAGVGDVWPFGRRLVGGDDARAIAYWGAAWARAASVSSEVFEADDKAPAAALQSLCRGRLGDDQFDLTVDLIAIAVLRAWARWLPGFEHSSAPYLLDRLVRRPGLVHRRADSLIVVLKRQPLDLLLDEFAGYTAPIDARDELGLCIEFRMVEA
jgi:hypothetical protein